MNSKMLVGWVVGLAAVSWGLVGVFNINVVEAVLGSGTVLTKVVYALVGVAGLAKLYHLSMGKK